MPATSNHRRTKARRPPLDAERDEHLHAVDERRREIQRGEIGALRRSARARDRVRDASPFPESQQPRATDRPDDVHDERAAR